MKSLEAFRKKDGFLIPVSLIDLDPDLPRKYFKADKVKEMSDSIKEKGVLQPLIVRSKKDGSGKYLVVIGKMRLKSSLVAGLREVPCFVEDVDDKEAMEFALIENVQRDDLSPFEEGWGILKLIKNFDYSIGGVCKKIGKSHDFVSSRLKLLSLPEEIQEFVAQGKLGIENASCLVSLKNKEQLETSKEVIANSLSRGQVKQLVLDKIGKDKIKTGSGGMVRKKSMFKQIELQSKLLARLLNHSDLRAMLFSEKENLKFTLTNLKELVDKKINEIEELILNDD